MYYLSKSVDIRFEDAVAATKQSLKRHHFEVLAEVDLREILRKHLAVHMHPYVILSASTPELIGRAIEANDKIGSILFCNVVVCQSVGGSVEISVPDPTATIGKTNQIELVWIAQRIRSVLEKVFDDIGSQPVSRQQRSTAMGPLLSANAKSRLAPRVP
jgi:uncharacterized protein (DUF302 family)